MRSLVVILLALAYCEARPNPKIAAVATLSPESYILGGVDASPGEFPWQLSQQRGAGASWSHSCGASLLSPNYALSAAHCVEGANPAIIRVVAGLHQRSNEAGASASIASSLKLNEAYNDGSVTFSNDIAIISLATPIQANGGSIQFATLPPNHDDLFAGLTATLSGWGRNTAANTLPDTLQKVDITVLSTDECNTRMAPVSGARVSDNQVCFYNPSNNQGSCNGDSGGPANLNGLVIGVTSWGISGGGSCLPSYPSAYTRTSAFLGWIAANTP